jgi:pyruvate dehydrogenase E2 component (dihydrolipoamide acetyltransferase)
VTPLVRWRHQFVHRDEGDRPSYTALFVQAAARTLKSFPDLNASIRGTSLYRWRLINIGVAVARQDGLIVPVIPDADQRSLADIMSRLRSFGSSHADPLPADAARGGTFTVSNLGMYGADSVLSVIYPGQAGILSLGRVRPKPVEEAGKVVIRSVLRMTLAFDHRILDGAMAAQFLARLEALFASPESWAR